MDPLLPFNPDYYLPGFTIRNWELQDRRLARIAFRLSLHQRLKRLN